MNNLSFDPQTTWAFLIGNWEFKEDSQLPNLSAVENNLTSLKEILIDSSIFGMPEHQIIFLKNQSDILQCFITTFPKPVETLIVYYAGHGLYDGTNLSLALPNSLHNDADTGLAFDKLWKKITNKATNIILILDCCFSGKAFNAITKQDGRNIVVLTATDKANLASSPKNWGKTAFTEYFIQVLKQGIRNHQPCLTLKDISNVLKETLVEEKFPKPSENEFLDHSPFYCFRNLGFKTNNLPAKNDHFSGRENVLKQLDDLIHKKSVVALYGLGGIGKTQVAVQYVHLHKHQYNLVLWITAETVEDFQHSLEELAVFLNISTDKKQSEQILKEITQTLRVKKNWLLLIDNVEDLADSQPTKKSFFNLFGLFQKKRNELTIIRDFLAEIKDYGKVILTTRLPSINPMVETIEIEKMEVIEGTQFLLKRTRKVEENFEKHRDFNLAKKLVKTMDGLPLALEQAAAYILDEPCSFQEYLAIYQHHKKELLAKRGTFSHPNDHPLPLTVTLEIVFEKLKKHHRKTLKLLEYCALLPPDTMPEIVFQQLFHVEHLGFMDILKPAQRHSLLKRDVDHKQLLIHRLVQTVLKFNLNDTEQKYLFSYLIDALAVLLPSSKDINNWHLFKRLRPLVFICFEAIQKHQIQTVNVANLLNTMAVFLNDAIGNYEQALLFLMKSKEIREKVLGKEHPDVAASLNNLAALYDSQGKVEEALPLSLRALEIREKVLGKEHPDVATSLNNLALLYLNQGKYEQALPLYLRALEIFEKALGKEHPNVALSLNNLAELYRNQGKVEEALPLSLRALEIREKVLGKEHPSVATSLNNLATLYLNQGKYEEALPLLEESVRILAKVLGEQHPNTQTVKANYERCLEEMK